MGIVLGAKEVPLTNRHYCASRAAKIEIRY